MSAHCTAGGTGHAVYHHSTISSRQSAITGITSGKVHKGSKAFSIGNPVVDEERMRLCVSF